MEFSISNGDEWRAKHTVETTNLNMILKIVDFYHKIQYSKFISQDTIFQREKHNTEKKNTKFDSCEFLFLERRCRRNVHPVGT